MVGSVVIPSEPRSATVCGFACTVNDALGHIEVAYDGAITWDQIQAVKTPSGASARGRLRSIRRRAIW